MNLMYHYLDFKKVNSDLNNANDKRCPSHPREGLQRVYNIFFNYSVSEHVKALFTSIKMD